MSYEIKQKSVSRTNGFNFTAKKMRFFPSHHSFLNFNLNEALVNVIQILPNIFSNQLAIILGGGSHPTDTMKNKSPLYIVTTLIYTFKLYLQVVSRSRGI